MKIRESIHSLYAGITPKKILYFLLPIAIILILYAPFLLMKGVFIGEWHDLLTNTFFFKVVELNYFSQWCNLFAGGIPLTANPNSDLYYPFSVPFYILSQSYFVVNILLVLHLIIAYFSFRQLGTLVTKNENALLLFSLFYIFSADILSRVYAGHHILIYGLAWIPLVLYFFLKITVYSEPTTRNALLLTLVSAILYFSGDVYHVILLILLMGIFCLVLIVQRNLTKKAFFLLLGSGILTGFLIAIKLIPDFNVSDYIVRVDAINPFTGGGSFENNLASFMFGTRIDSVWATYESAVLAGTLAMLLLVIALLYGNRNLAIPSFFVILFSFVYADGGNTLLSFIHNLPLLGMLRNPGRIFGVVFPIVLFMSLYGLVLLYTRWKQNDGLSLNPGQRKTVFYGILICVAVKILELPYQQIPSLAAVIAVIILAGFIVLIYLNKARLPSVLIYFGVSLVLELIVIEYNNPLSDIVSIVKIVLIALLVSCIVLLTERRSEGKPEGKPVKRYLCGILVAGVIISLCGTSGYVTIFQPNLESSPAPAVLERIISEANSSNVQIWVYETGWPWQHMDFTYWDIQNGVHPMTLYSAYYLKTVPQLSYTIKNRTYFSADYIIDTAYLETGNRSFSEETFKVGNISVYKPDAVIPMAFVLRGDTLIPVQITEFSSGHVAGTGNFQSGDIAVLKAAFYPGWKINDQNAVSYGNLVAVQLTNQANSLTFSFEPEDYRVGVGITLIGIILLIVLWIYRNKVDHFLSDSPVTHKVNKSAKLKK